MLPGCCIMLALGTVLCAAGGIDGGVIIAALLINFGGLSLYDCVPLATAVVFMDAIVSFAMNVYKQIETPSPDGGTTRPVPLINWDICQLMVPSALLGTLLGVMYNRIIPQWSIALILVVVLSSVACMTLWKLWQQHHGQRVLFLKALKKLKGASKVQVPDEEGYACEDAPLLQHRSDTQLKPAVYDTEFFMVDCLNLSVIMIVTVLGGVLKHGAETCMEDKIRCSTFLRWTNLAFLDLGGWTEIFGWSAILVSSWTCFAMAGYYAYLVIMHRGWGVRTVILYQTIALLTGLLGGLVGIGCGVIFAPALFIFRLDPAVAKATSSTCVLFTACSTCTQYFLMGRIQLSLAIAYGTVNAAVSFFGTPLVHRLQDQLRSRRWAVSALVSAAVVLLLPSFMSKMHEQHQSLYLTSRDDSLMIQVPNDVGSFMIQVPKMQGRKLHCAHKFYRYSFVDFEKEFPSLAECHVTTYARIVDVAASVYPCQASDPSKADILMIPPYLAEECNWPHYGGGLCQGFNTFRDGKICRNEVLAAVTQLQSKLPKSKILLIDQNPYWTPYDLLNTTYHRDGLIFAKVNSLQQHYRKSIDVSMPPPATPRCSRTPMDAFDRPLHKKKYYLSFKGGLTKGFRASVRDLLHNGEDRIVADSSEPWDFDELLYSSKFSLILRGHVEFTYRFNEVVCSGAIPVLVTDKWVPPFNELVPFENYGVLIKEDQVNELLTKLKSLTDKDLERLRSNAHRVCRDLFSDSAKAIHGLLEYLTSYQNVHEENVSSVSGGSAVPAWALHHSIEAYQAQGIGGRAGDPERFYQNFPQAMV